MKANTDWIGTYGTKKFQEGGAMAAPAAPAGGAPAEAPAEGGGGGELEGMIAEYAQTRDPQLAVAICDMIVDMMAQGGGAAPGGAPAEGGAAPMAKKGMKMKKGPVFKGSCKK